MNNEICSIVGHETTKVFVNFIMTCILYVSFYYRGEMWVVTRNKEWVPKNNPCV